jgi:[protein-PII] uridylyltransferase
MASVLKQRQIIDRAAIEAALSDAYDEETPSNESRHALFLQVKTALEAGHAEIRKRFEEGELGEATVRANAFLMDQLLRIILDSVTSTIYPTASASESERIAVAAVGGYGRGEMAPSSDIDLLFLLPYRVTPRVEQIVECVLYMLWDLGLKVGHATRSVDECLRLARGDITIRTAVLEARYLWGNRPLFNTLRKRFINEVAKDSGPQFTEAKLAERDQRHEKMGGSRYVLEPNVKDGKGGLRDLQTLFWIAKYIYQVDSVADLVERGVLTAQEAQRFARAENFLWTVRCHLHYLAGREEDRLTFDRQPEIGARMGYRDHAGTLGVERFMKHYFLTAKEVGDLTRIFCAALEAEHRRRPRFSLPSMDIFKRDADGFPLESGRLSVKSSKTFTDDPVSILRLFHTAQARDLEIHPKALRLITRNLKLVDGIRDDAEANRLFVEMLTFEKGPEVTLRRLNEAGVFGRFVPDFGRVVAQMQHDMYHVYTVDEHTIFALGILHGIEKGEYAEDMPVATDVVHKVSSRRALYVAVLLHDIAKGRGGDHSKLGAEVALKLGPRFGLTAEETETVSWLVLNHLIMSGTAFHRDLNDPKTINDFAEAVQSLERLRLLLVLTVADIRAVGPNVWNAWKATLIRDLYYRAEEVLSGGHDSRGREVRIKAAKNAVSDGLAGWKTDDVEAFLDLGYPSYWLSVDTARHLRHAEMIRKAEADEVPVAIESRVEDGKDATQVTIYTTDHPGLFSQIAGAMAMSGANIVAAQIFTMTNGMALDIFEIQDAQGAAFEQKAQIDRLEKNIVRALEGRVRPARELAKKPVVKSRTEIFTVAPRALINNSASRTHSVVEVNGRDRPGLLHDVTQALTDMNLQISSAMIFTYGERAVDVFYVKDAFGMQVTNEGKLARLRDALELALLPLPQREKVIAAREKEAAERMAARVPMVETPAKPKKKPATKKPAAKKAPAKKTAAKAATAKTSAATSEKAGKAAKR